MATHKSALKRARQNIKREARNRAHRSRLRTVLKELPASDEQIEDLPGKLRSAERELRRAASKGLIPKSRANRKISRLHRRYAISAK